MKYIHQNQLFDLIELKENMGYKIGMDISDTESFVKLSVDQITFLETNPNASIPEIWKLKLNEVVPIPELSVSEKRSNAYKYEKNITFKGNSLTVDEAVVIYHSYLIEDNISDSYELKGLIVSTKNDIRARII